MSGVDDTYTKSLLHFNGTDASTTFTDESGKTWTAYGNAQIDTAQSKFGGASILFDGTGDYIDTSNHDDFIIGTSNFTIDFWYKKAVDNTLLAVFGKRDSIGSAAGGTFTGYIGSDNKWYLEFSNLITNGWSGLISTGTATGTAWHHFALVRLSGVASLYIDGVLDKSETITNNLGTGGKFAIGCRGEYRNNPFNGWIDEFRFTNHLARWNGAFTPPISAYDYVTPSTVFIPKISIF